MPDKKPSSKVSLTAGAHGNVVGRPRISSKDLLEIERILTDVPFTERKWEVRDEQGQHTGEDIAAVLRNVLWRSVTFVRVDAYQRPLSGELGSFTVWLGGMPWAAWTAPPQTDREAIERAYKRVVELLERLPQAGLDEKQFVGTIDIELPPVEVEEPRPRRHWWQAWRQPESVTDALVRAVAGLALAVAATVIGGSILLALW